MVGKDVAVQLLAQLLEADVGVVGQGGVVTPSLASLVEVQVRVICKRTTKKALKVRQAIQ